MDIAINNGKVVNPETLTEELLNIGIKDGKIVTLSHFPIEAKTVIDAKGLVVSPGFIDIHMHEEPLVDKEGQGVIGGITFEAMARMGVTTAIGGNCGIMKCNSDIEGYIDYVKSQGLPINLGLMIGHEILRKEVGLDRYLPASREQIQVMVDSLDRHLSLGNYLGLSFGLEYMPGTTTNEMIELGKIVKEYTNNLISVHYRFDGPRSMESVKELVFLSEVLEAPVQISHIGSCCMAGTMKKGLEIIERAWARGVDVLADCYPYAAFCTSAGSAVFDPGCLDRWDMGYDALEVTQGKYQGYRCTEEIFNYIRKEEPQTYLIAHVMREDDVTEALKHPLVMVASDGILYNGKGHPRAAGTFPRVLGKYVREEGHLSLIEAIYKMTLMPAQRLGLATKGRIRLGMDADITIFNENTVKDQATFSQPTLPPVGIEYVLVNGKEVVARGEFLGGNCGKLIRYY